MEAEPSYRPSPEPGNKQLQLIILGLSLLVLLIFYIFNFHQNFISVSNEQEKIFSKLYDKYQMEPLIHVNFGKEEFRQKLLLLTNEPCDQDRLDDAVNSLIQDQGQKRGAVALLLGFSRACPDSSKVSKQAADILYNLAEYSQALSAVDNALHVDPQYDNAIYLRALILSRLGQHKRALASYEDLISKSKINPEEIKLEVFTEMAKSYASIGMFCDAVTVIQSYIEMDQSRRKTNVLEEEMKSYSKAGYCEEKFKGKEERFYSNGGIYFSKVNINGQEGRFIIDTGASLVYLNHEFAKRANITGVGEEIVSQTANGNVKDEEAFIDTISIGDLTARYVRAAISNKNIIEGFDGLLGMSFLSRFSVFLKDNSLTISWSADIHPSIENKASSNKKTKKHR